MSVHRVSSEKNDDAGAGGNKNTLLVQDEIWRVVSEAANSEASLAIGHHAERIVESFPQSGYSAQDIKDALVFAAVDRGVVVEVGKGARTDVPIIEVSALRRAAGRLTGRRRGRKQGANGEPALVPV